ncbi:hypothetical protein KR026_002312 [Drosophila bipectinata]|nr:hypothetical protein KR026_002312 [Drosophila bipectinata]
MKKLWILAFLVFIAAEEDESADYSYLGTEGPKIERGSEPKVTVEPKKTFNDWSGFQCGHREHDPTSLNFSAISDLKTFRLHPWMVAIYSNESKNFIAIGTLIRYDVVITALKGIENVPDDQLVVEAGIMNRTETKQLYRFARSVSTNLSLALIHLTTPFTMQFLHVRPICLPLPNEVFTERYCGTVGWYLNSTNIRDKSITVEKDFLWQRPYVVMGNVDCLTEFNETIDNNTICCKDKLNIFLPLNIGAGLVCRTDKFVLAGVSLLNSDWVMDNKPTLFVNIPDYLPWIESELQPYFDAASHSSQAPAEDSAEYQSFEEYIESSTNLN